MMIEEIISSGSYDLIGIAHLNSSEQGERSLLHDRILNTIPASTLPLRNNASNTHVSDYSCFDISYRLIRIFSRRTPKAKIWVSLSAISTNR
jgi:hypothetical protein